MKYNNYINSIKLNTKLYIRALFLLVALIPFSAFSDKNIFDNNKEIKKMEQRATNVIQQINNKKKFIETAKLKGKVKYDLPLDKKINLRKTFYIQKESKIHIDIYLLLKLKVAEFISDSSRIKYKRINRSPKIKNIESFNLNIFNKHLDLDLSVQELNNLLLGLNLIDIVNKPYDYSFKGEQLIIIQGGNRCIVNLKSNQITKITLNENPSTSQTFTQSNSSKSRTSSSNRSQAVSELLAEQKKLSRQNKILEQKIISLQSNETSLESDPRQGQPANALISLNSSNEQSNLQKLNSDSSNLLYQVSSRTRLEQARLYIKDNKASQALLALENFTPEENNRAEYHFLTGRAYQELKLNTKALASYSIAIHLNAGHYKALNNRGLIKGALKDMSGAMDDLNKSIQANPTYAPAYMNRGVTRAALKKLDLAIEDFTKAIVLDPAYGDAYRNRGITYKFRGNITGACRDWLKAGELGQSSAQSWFQRHCKRKG